MKITNEVKSYIRRLVQEKAVPELNKLNDIIKREEGVQEEKLKKYIEDIEKERSKFLEKLEVIASKHKMHFSCPYYRNNKDKAETYSDFKEHFKPDNNELIEETKEKLIELRRKVDTAINDTIARMSLGGCAKDLDEIINSLVF